MPVDKKKSINTYQTNCLTVIASAEEFAGENAHGFTEAGKKQAEKHIAKCEEKFDRMSKRWEDVFKAELEGVDDNVHDELEAIVNATGEKIDKITKTLYRLMDKPTIATETVASKTLKLETGFKPPILLASNNLEEFNSWQKTFLAHVDQNKAYLTASTQNIRRTFVTSLLDSRLNSALDTDSSVTEDMPIVGRNDDEKSLLSWIKKYFLRHLPLFIRRFEYSNCKQEKKESFDDWWTRKLTKAKECDLAKVNLESIQITELICGTSNRKLREDCLRLQDPKLEDLVALGRQYDTAAKVQKNNFGEEVNVNKTSDYKRNKNESWSKNKADTTGMGSSKVKCKHCGGTPCWKQGPDKVCKAKGMECFSCGKKGHLKPACTEKSKRAVVSKTVRINHVVAKKIVEDDCEATPTCRMAFKTNEGRKFFKEVLPDTGCSQTIIAKDLVCTNNMAIDRSKKKNIKNASDERMACEGTVTFEVEFEGQKTDVVALVSSDLAGEVLLGWRALKRLKIIPEGFPHVSKTLESADTRRVDAEIGCTEGSGCTGSKASAGTRRTSAETGSTESNADSNGEINSCGHTLAPHEFINNPEEVYQVRKTHADSCGHTLAPHESVDPKVKIEKAMDAFPAVFEEPGGLDGGQLNPMKGGEMTIHLKPGPRKPTHIFTARKCPYAFENQAKAELDRSETLGIIEKVEGASEWCSPMSFVRKPGGRCRTVVDLKGLNEHVLRPTHPFPAAKDIIATIPSGSKRFAVFDCHQGYHQIVLDKKSRPLTTFLTEFGRYRYLRAPMGLNSSGDEFCRRTDEAMEGLEGVKKLVDDILIFAPDDETLLERIVNVFKRCSEWGITLAKSKFQYGNSVKFAGFIVNETGWKPDPEKVAAIKDFPVPKDITNLKSFMGLANQFASFAPDLKHAMVPMQPLLKKNNVYQWLPEHQMAFDKVKEILTSENGPILAQFDPKLPVTLITDASRTGLGYILAQDDGLGGHTRLITCGSRFLSPAEANYAVIELECMAIQWSIIKCRNYLLGVDFVVRTDHKPLLGVINGKDLDAVNNARLQRILSKLLGFQYKVEFVPGKLNLIADALSRAPVFQPDFEDQQDVLVQTLKVESVANDPKLHVLTEAAACCPEYCQVVEAVTSKKELKMLPSEHPARKYLRFWKVLAFEADVGLLSIHGRIVVPKEARKAILQSLHAQHTGILKTWKNARQLYYWPGMKNDIVQMVGNCQQCVMHLPSLPKEPCLQTKSMRPFEAMSVDLGILDGTHYLVCVDRYSGWPMVAKLTNLETKAITNILEDWFVDIGKPLRLRSDGGPQFRSEFVEWCQEQGIEHELSSADHHESNGHAEAAVKAMKHLLAKTKSWRSFRKALIEWRNTPRCSDGLSPAQWALGRRQRSDCPALPEAYNRLSDQDFSKALIRREEVMAKVKKDFDKDRRSLTRLPVGTLVVLQDRSVGGKTGRWNRKGTIVERKRDRNTYIVEVDGRRFLRNRIFLRPCLHQSEPDVDEDDEEQHELPVHEEQQREPPVLRRSERTRQKSRR